MLVLLLLLQKKMAQPFLFVGFFFVSFWVVFTRRPDDANTVAR